MRPARRRAGGTERSVSLTGPDFWSPNQGGVLLVGTGHLCFFCEQRIRREPRAHGAERAVKSGFTPAALRTSWCASARIPIAGRSRRASDSMRWTP